MSLEISEQDTDDDDNVVSMGSHDGRFVDEFTNAVSIKTIMSGSRSIGRNEARLMLAQFRGVAIEMISSDDPGVLMLDGLAISELEEFLESGGESLEITLRGAQNDDIELLSQGTDNFSNNNEQQQYSRKRTNLTQLRKILSDFRHATDSHTKDDHRQQFFFCYGSLNEAQKKLIQPQIRSQIENTILLDAAHQETLLMTMVLPTEQEAAAADEEIHHQTTSTIGEKYRTFTEDDAFKAIPHAQGKNLTSWICKNCGSQHVWFFMAGFCLFWIFFIQTWVDYAFGDIWRALLMELLCLASILIMMMEADTDFIRMQIQERLYNYYQFLASVEGRTWFYLFLCFCAFGKLTIYDLMAIIGGTILMLLTITRFILYQWSETLIDVFVIKLNDSQQIRQKFKEMDQNDKNYLDKSDINYLIDSCCFCRGWLKEIIFWRIDHETNDGKIDIHEFVQFCLKFKAHQKMDTEIRDSRKGLSTIDSNQLQSA